MARPGKWVAVGRTVARVTYRSDLRYLATSMAYYAFLSFVPLLVLAFAVLGRQLANDIAAVGARFVTPSTQVLIYRALTTASGRTGAVLLSSLALAWGGTNLAVDYLTGLARIETMPDRPPSDLVRDGAVVLGTVVLAMLAILLQSLTLAVLTPGFPGTLLGFGALLVALTVVFLPLYYVPSRLVTSLPGAFPGALTTGCGWTLIHAGIQFYTSNAAQYAIYGVLSGIIIILTSTYLAALVLMTGMVVNAVLATDADGQFAASR